MTTAYPLKHRAPVHRQTSYRPERTYTLLEEAKLRNSQSTHLFRRELDLNPSALLDSMAVAGIAGAMGLLALVGNLFLDNLTVLQIAALALSAHATRRAFSLLHAKNNPRSASQYRKGDYRRHLTNMDAAALLGVLLVAVMLLNLGAVGQLVAGAAVALAVIGARHVSIKVIGHKIRKAQEERELKLLTAGM